MWKLIIINTLTSESFKVEINLVNQVIQRIYYVYLKSFNLELARIWKNRWGLRFYGQLFKSARIEMNSKKTWSQKITYFWVWRPSLGRIRSHPWGWCNLHPRLQWPPTPRTLPWGPWPWRRPWLPSDTPCPVRHHNHRWKESIFSLIYNNHTPSLCSLTLNCTPSLSSLSQCTHCRCIHFQTQNQSSIFEAGWIFSPRAESSLQRR